MKLLHGHEKGHVDWGWIENLVIKTKYRREQICFT